MSGCTNSLDFPDAITEKYFNAPKRQFIINEETNKYRF